MMTAEQKYVKTINRLKLKCEQYKKSSEERKEGIRQHERFCHWLLENNRVTKAEMKPFFVRRRDLALTGDKQ